MQDLEIRIDGCTFNFDWVKHEKIMNVSGIYYGDGPRIFAPNFKINK